MPAASPSPSLLTGFPPVVDSHIRILVLGSFPGAASLAAKQYYAHPRNQFWDLAGMLIGVGLRPLPYKRRLEVLLSHGIGLWDVLAKAERAGSLDAAIRNEIRNPLQELVQTLPQLRGIGFNGGTAARHGRRMLAGMAHRLALIDLPSSSPAYTLAFEHKRLAWSRLAEYLHASGD